MKKYALPFVIILVLSMSMSLLGCSKQESSASKSSIPASSSNAGSTGAKQVEIIYLAHPPVQPIVDEISAIVREQGIEPVIYNFDSSEGKEFAKDKKITEHVPIVIYIDGKNEFEVAGQQVKFYSFPADIDGAFPVQGGSWTSEDLIAVLQEGNS